MSAGAPAAVWLDADRRKLAAQLRELGYDVSTVSDALESAGRARLSASTDAQRADVLWWLGTVNGEAAYIEAAKLRRALLEAVKHTPRAQLAAAAATYGERRTSPSRWSARTLLRAIAAVRVGEALLERDAPPRRPFEWHPVPEVAA